MKRTPWFNKDVKPVRIGWYERDWGSPDLNRMPDYWDGLNWRYGDGSLRTHGIAPAPRRWRGLTSENGK